MFRMTLVTTTSLAALLAFTATAATGQTAASVRPPHMVVVHLVDRGGPKPYAFQPAAITAQHGDTLRFVDDVDVPHNVRFTKHASGAHLGGAESGPYLTTKGEKYDLVIDKRFADGAYEYVCDPHAAIGMKGTLVVGTTQASR